MTDTLNTIARTVAPKNTFINGLDNGIVEAKLRDDSMFNILVDTTKHQAFFNAKGDKETFLKTGWISQADGVELNVQARRVKTSAEKQAKNIREKIAKLIAGKAKEGDISYLANHGFLNDSGDGLDMGKVEAVYLDNVAAAAKERATKALAKAAKDNADKVKEQFAANNGSLVASVSAS